MNNETKHTPEPWQINRHGAIVGGTPVAITRGEVLQQIAMVCGLEDGDAQANARRIVACVNACADFDTESLERFGADKGLRGKLDRADLKTQRDELAAALRKVRDLEPISVDEITALLAKVQS